LSYGWGHHNDWTRSYHHHSECHTGNVLVFTTHDDIAVWAGGSSRDGGWWKMKPLPDLAMGPDNEVKKGYSRLKVDTKAVNMEGWKCAELLVERKPPAVLEMDFPDYSVPQDCNVLFWETLALDIREQGVKSIHAMCMGGHGRTGIQLACLRWFLATEEERKEWPDAHTLITSIREVYCEKAVEADSQQAYVARMCDIPLGEKLSFHKGYGTVTQSSASKTLGEVTSHNCMLLECDSCDLVMFEDTKINKMKEGDLCYDTDCDGRMIDITDLAIKRGDHAAADGYGICIATLDVTSDISAVTVGHLTTRLMEKHHGKEWEKKLNRLMTSHKKDTVRGTLLRELNRELKEDGLEEANILVCITDVRSDPEIIGKDPIPNTRKWMECGFCDKNTSPDRLTPALKVSKNGIESLTTCCPQCVTESGLEFYDKFVVEDDSNPFLVKVDADDYPEGETDCTASDGLLLQGLSINNWYSVRNLRDDNHLASANMKALKGMIEEDESMITTKVKGKFEKGTWVEEDDDGWPHL